MIVLLISLLFNAAFLLYLYIDRNYNYWTKRGVIGPTPQVPFGTFPNDFTKKKHMSYETCEIYNQYKGMAQFVGIFKGRKPGIIALDPELMKNVLVSDFKSFEINEFAQMIDKESDKIFSKNPFMLDGAEWKDKRNEITPAFTPARLKAMFPIIQEVGSMNFISYIKDKMSMGSFDAKDLSVRFTTDVVLRCIYGIESNAFSEEASVIRQKLWKLNDFSSLFSPFFFAQLMMPWLKKIHTIKIVSKDIEDFFTDLMKQAIALRKGSQNRSGDFLDYVLDLKDKKNLSELDMVAHTMAFLSDGTETSSVVLAILLYYLSKNPRVQDKLRTEIVEAEISNGTMSMDKMNSLTYLDQVLNESMRIRPAATFITKICSSNIKLDYNGRKVEIEKGSTVTIPISSVQNDSRFWTNPDEFYPERFDAENGGVKKYKDLGVFLPFSDGPRVCLGMRFAITQIKMATLHIVRNFKIMPSSKMADTIELDAKTFWPFPKGGLWVDLKDI